MSPDLGDSFGSFLFGSCESSFGSKLLDRLVFPVVDSESTGFLALLLLRTLVLVRETGLDLVLVDCLRIGCRVVNGADATLSVLDSTCSPLGDVLVRCLLVVLDLLPTNLDLVL